MPIKQRSPTLELPPIQARGATKQWFSIVTRLVIVALLQGDDIAQLIERQIRVPAAQSASNIVNRIRNLIWQHLPHLASLARLIGTTPAKKPELATASWGADA